MSHSSDEVSVRRRNALLTFCQDAHMPAETRSAGRCGNDAPRIDEDLQKAFGQALLIHSLRARKDDRADPFCDVAALKDGRCFLHIFQTAVGARTDHDLVDLYLTEGSDCMSIGRQMRERYHRRNLGKIDRDGLFVYGIGIREQPVGSLLVPALDTRIEIRDRLFVDRENTVFGAAFDRHITDRQAVRHRKLRDTFARELQRSVERAVDTDTADQIKDDIFSGNIRARLSF